jgi:hypothetical protein
MYCTYSIGFVDFLPHRLGFNPVQVHVGFVVNKVALIQVFLPALPFYTVSIIPPILHTHVSCTYLRHDVILATVSIVK